MKEEVKRLQSRVDLLEQVRPHPSPSPLSPVAEISPLGWLWGSAGVLQGEASSILQPRGPLVWVLCGLGAAYDRDPQDSRGLSSALSPQATQPEPRSSPPLPLSL